jgi:hypothetical protein
MLEAFTDLKKHFALTYRILVELTQYFGKLAIFELSQAKQLFELFSIDDGLLALV